MAEPKIQGGCFLISRQLMNSGIMNKPPEYLKVWIHLLSNAYFKDKDGLKRGQGFTSLEILKDVLSYKVGYRTETPTKKKVYGIIEWLRNPHEGTTKGTMIVTTKVTHGFVYTIVNYDLYQDMSNYEGNNEGTTKVERRYSEGNNIKKNVKECNNDNKKDNDNAINDIDVFFEKVWNLYPLKKGKGSIKLAAKKKIYKNKDVIEICIERYVDYVEGRRKTFPDMPFMNGSTFFNSGYVDYLDENYIKIKPTPKAAKSNNFNSYEQRVTDFEAIERKAMEMRISESRKN